MKHTHKFVLILLAAATVGVSSARATTIQMELFDSFALVNSDGVTPLAGNAIAGDLVQVILTGPDDAINGPSSFNNGQPSGDDTVLFTLHVGTGIPMSGTGMLDAYPLDYNSSLVNTDMYVRFWNGTTVADSTYYGNSSIFQLPPGDAFNQSSLDFVPTSGSPHTTDQPFSLSVVPEPSSLLLVSLLGFGAWMWKKRRHIGLVAVGVGLLIAVQNTSAQLGADQDVYNSVAIFNTSGTELPGSNPSAPSNGCTAIPGCLVEILNVGSNGVAHVANLDGTPSGGDTILFTTVVGQGIDPCTTLSGQFSTSFYPAPASGTKMYARVFNAPTTAQATAWGQSADFTVTTVDGAQQPMDLSALGMEITTMPIGIDLSTLDSKGVTYLDELVANTNPQNPNDLFDVNGIAMQNSDQSVQLGENGKAGRQYTLQRTTDDLTGTVNWTDVNSTGVLNANGNLLLNDPSPPKATKAFYRVRITMP